MLEDFAPNFSDKELGFASLQRTFSHFLFHQSPSDMSPASFIEI
jgi:hypothetical protein